MRFIFFSIFVSILPSLSAGQNGFGNNWILGYPTTPDISGSQLDFNHNPVTVIPLQKDMEMEGSIAVMSNSSGDLQFYSNGCYIANKNHVMILNGDSIGMGLLETSFCETGGNPLIQGIIALPAPSDTSRYYIFYTDLKSPYEYPTGLYFPLAPLNLYYSIIDMNGNHGEGAITHKNHVIISDTLARSMIQATKHRNENDWWIIMPKSHSNCYYTLRLSKNGIDTSFLQCIGEIWGDDDLTGQAVFSPNRGKYVRFNYFYGLNIFDFSNITGLFSNPIHITFGLDTFNYSGTAFSPNSKFLYAAAYSKIFQFDMHSMDIENSKLLIAELNTPPGITYETRFNQAMLASDGKIYIGGTNTHTYLHCIHNPNCQGKNCNFEQYFLEMPAYNIYGLPNIPNFNDWKEDETCDISANTSIGNISVEFKVFPNPFNEKIFFKGIPPYSIAIFDALGKTISRTEYEDIDGSIFLTNQPSGLYYYQILVKNEIKQTGKLIKVK